MTEGENSTPAARAPLKILLLEGGAEDSARLSRILAPHADEFLLLDGDNHQKRAYKERMDFSTTACHDLKAPLRHIVTYCQILRDEFADRLGTDGETHIHRLMINASRLQRLVDDLLAYAEATDGVEDMREVDVEEQARQALEFLEDTITETKAQVIIEKMPHLRAYPLRLRQLLQNLFSNALKYRAEDPPRILLRCDEAAHEFKFSVADNGIGVEAEYREMIFEAFRRLHSRDKIEGSGLGLSICKKIVEMHRGRIWVESAPGAGSTFYFTMPKAFAAATA